MAIVGLVESLLTAKIVDDATDTYSSKTENLVAKALLMITGLFGGMGGCAMIGQSVINQIRCKQQIIYFFCVLS